MRSRDQGVTLVEVLVSVVLLGVAFTALLVSMGTSSVTSRIHRQQSTGAAFVRSYAEAVRAVPYRACGSAGQYTSDAAGSTPVPAGFATPVVSEVRYFLGTGGGTVTGGSFQAACTIDSGVQRLTVSVASTDGVSTETLQLVKRRA